MKRFLWIVGVLLVVGVVLAVVGSKFVQFRGGFSTQLPGTEVRTEPVTRGDLVEIVSAPGQFEPRTKVQISARIAARIAELPFKEGESITQGNPEKGVPPSVLVKLDASDLEAELKSAEALYEAQKANITVAEVRIRSAEASLESMKVSFADAQRDLRRQLTLFETNDVSQSVVDVAQVKVDQLRHEILASEQNIAAERANLDVLKFNLASAAANTAQVRERLSYAVITSPLDGTVLRVNAKVGELVVTGTMNNAGTVIMEVADLARMLVVARVDEASIAGIRVGQRATARSTAYPGKTFSGTVTLVPLSKTTQALATNRGEPYDGQPYYRCEILLDEGSEVVSGVSTDIEIETRRHSKVLKVPSQAVLGRPFDELPEDVRNSSLVDRNRSIATVVFALRGGKAIAMPVKIGPSDLTHTLIEAGLGETDVVITGPYKALEGLKNDADVKLLGSTTRPATSGPTTGSN